MPGDITLALLAQTQFSSHKLHGAKSSRQQPAQVVGPRFLNTPGMGIFGVGTTMWDRSSAGGSDGCNFL